MSKKKKGPQEKRQPGYYVQIMIEGMPTERGICLKKYKEPEGERPEAFGRKKSEPSRRGAWLILYRDGRMMVWPAHHVRFKERVPLMELLTYGDHPELIKMAMEMKKRQEERNK
jgi:hypothetical protein